MPLPIIANTYLARLVWTDANAPRPAVNDLHFKDTAGTHTAADLMAALDAHVTTNQWQLVSSNALVDHVDITKLDGTSASQTFTPATPGNWVGSGGTDPILQGAMVVSFKSALRGPKFRNRIYLPWIGETGQAAGVLTPANVVTMQTAWTAFVAAMNTAGFPLAVVSPSASSQQPALQAVCRPFLKTQRRRARR